MRRYLQKYSWQNILLGLSLILLAGLQTASSTILSFATNRLTIHDPKGFFIWMGIDLVIWLFLLLASFLSDVYKASLIQQMNTDMRQDLMQSAQQSLATYRANTESYYTSGMMNDINQTNERGFQNLYLLIQTVGIIIFSTSAIIFLQWRLMVLTLILGIVAIAAPRALNRLISRSAIQMSKANEDALNAYIETVKGTETLIGLGRKQEIIDRITQISRKLKNKTVQFTRVNAGVSNISGAVSIVNQTLLMAYTGWLVIVGQTKIGTLLSIASLAGLFFSATGSIGGSLAQLRGNERLFQKFSRKVHTRPSALVLADNSQTAFALQEVDYAATTEHEVFSDYTLNIQKGGKYFIIGPSGSGKSTILNLLTGRIQPQKGSVAVGSDVEQIRYLSQTPLIFSDTIRYNLELGEHFSDDELHAALKFVQINDEINELPYGIDTILVDGGQNISGGQKQRIALARTLLRKPKYLLLDEATSAIDPTNEHQILSEITAQSELTLIAVIHTNDAEILNLADHVISIGAVA